MSGKRMWYALLALVVVASLLAACAPAATPTPQVIVKKETQVVTKEVVKEVTAVPPPPAPTELTLVDINSGANFQWYWQNVVIPSIQEQLGVKVNYVVGNAAELTERMKAWESG